MPIIHIMLALLQVLGLLSGMSGIRVGT